MTDQAFKPAGAAFAAIVAGLAPAAAAVAEEARAADAEAELKAGLSTLAPLAPFEEPVEAPRADADVPLG